MIHAHQRLSPQQAQRPGPDGHGRKRSAHARPLCEADAVDVIGGDVGGNDGAAGERYEVCAVVGGGVFGEEARAGRGDEGVAEVGEDGGFGGGVKHDADAELVGGAFAAESDPRGFGVHYEDGVLE